MASSGRIVRTHAHAYERTNCGAPSMTSLCFPLTKALRSTYTFLTTPDLLETGAAVAEWLACSPPTKAIRVTPYFRMWELCRTMPLVGRFSRGSPVSAAPSFRRWSIFNSPQSPPPPKLVLKTSLLRAAQISSLTHSLLEPMERVSVPLHNKEPTINIMWNCFLYVGTNFTEGITVSGEIWVALNIEVLRATEGDASVGMQGRGKWEIPEKTRRPAASSGTIPTCENLCMRACGRYTTRLQGCVATTCDVSESCSRYVEFRTDPAVTNGTMERNEGSMSGSVRCVRPGGHVRGRLGNDVVECTDPLLHDDFVSSGRRQCQGHQEDDERAGQHDRIYSERLARVKWVAFGEAVKLLAFYIGEPGSIPSDLRTWESCRTMPQVGEFSRGSPVSPAFTSRPCSMLTSLHPHRLSRPRCQEPPKPLNSHFTYSWLHMTQHRPSCHLNSGKGRRVHAAVCIYVHDKLRDTKANGSGATCGQRLLLRQPWQSDTPVCGTMATHSTDRRRRVPRTALPWISFAFVPPTVTSAFPEALLKFYFLDIPPPRVH
ncbi:hypothetical protein PR048_018013 [Dryococelus australis]|uniref:Uncharacterized protein n=1 Tax=Dryococelus australis TaxID=614101 RepID=A0ABQ9HB88_9NEOP|nr:hypothetical protein PR048_018013 [Dryococelus australis]